MKKSVNILGCAMTCLLSILILLMILPNTVYAYNYSQMKAVTITGSNQIVDSITVNGKTVYAVYRKYDGTNGTDPYYSCAAFVKRFYLEVYGVDVYNLSGTNYVPLVANGRGSFVKVTNPQIGDIVRDNTNTHWAIVKEVKSNGDVVIIQQNAWAYNRTAAQIGTYIDSGDTTVTYFRYSGTSTSLFSNAYVEGVTETNAVVKGILNSVYSITNCGFYIGKDNSEMYKIVENANTRASELFYDINKWLGQLQPGTTYRYQLYAVINGTEYASEMKTFTTSGSQPSASYPLADQGIYWIRNVNSGKLLTADTNHTGIYQWADNGASQQMWQARLTEEGYYSFISVSCGTALDVNGANIAEGSEVVQYGYHGGTNQRFRLVDRGNYRYSIHPVSSNLALDVYGYSLDNGGAIKQYAFHGKDNQLWTFEPVDKEAPKINSVTVTDVSSDGYTVICSASDNIGVSRVCFPTWTEYNGQDDLANDWYNNAAVVSPNANNQYVYRVNISDHNNEAGNYITHVYVYDAVGNSSCYKDIRVPIYPLSRISLSKTAETLTAGSQMSLSVSYEPSNTTDTREVTWTSSNNRVASVDSNGNVTALSPGTAVITAQVSGKKTTCNVTVKAAPTPAPTPAPVNPPANDEDSQVRSFVSRMYTVALGRSAENQGLDYWTNRLLNQEIDGAGIAAGFICSTEFKGHNLNNNDFVNVLYRTFFDREPEQSGKEYWMQMLAAGRSREYVLSGFVNSQEFSNLCDRYQIARGTMQEDGSSVYRSGVREFVLRLYTRVLNRQGETSGVEYWTNQINTGRITAETTAKNFFASAEFAARNLNDADYVETLYQTFLGRASDMSGKNYWLSQLKNNMTREQVLEGFSQSVEFKNIMASYGL